MKQVETGDKVRVHYTGTLDDGTQFDSSAGRDPLEVEIGVGMVIPGFEQAILGMKPGETKSVTLAPEEAYGPHVPQLVQKVERERIPPEIDLEIGTALSTADQQGNPINLVVVELDEATVTLDANHPLAGRALTFELELVELVA
ncbi:FKBP-type peptidyl-prolyl cis-trans isomerase [Oceanibacterium hippocampi]|uniref:Peptidyl-prolyl cis-trans isomerase n=1 Tax=Oceanibacterium hippocampi TaxID=745714 RepID=A0A1Y5S2A9_9PROT|nr:peptidylprolyl isomerase [Oceanibacterium hippocampi]SLN31084.1 FKBP-type 16 kDa peptidyl-prolyl cis-trans isomerase [Oceanibacterium hippocampi]